MTAHDTLFEVDDERDAPAAPKPPPTPSGLFADIVFDRPLDHAYTYAAPAATYYSAPAVSYSSAAPTYYGPQVTTRPAVSLSLANRVVRLELPSTKMSLRNIVCSRLEEFLGDAHVGRLADVLGLTHSGAVRLVTQLERDGLAVRRTGDDRRRVEVRLTARGRRRAREARSARDAVIHQATSGLTGHEAETLEVLLDKVVAARVESRVEQRRAGEPGAWWCRTCDFAACG